MGAGLQLSGQVTSPFVAGARAAVERTTSTGGTVATSSTGGGGTSTVDDGVAAVLSGVTAARLPAGTYLIVPSIVPSATIATENVTLVVTEGVLAGLVAVSAPEIAPAAAVAVTRFGSVVLRTVDVARNPINGTGALAEWKLQRNTAPEGAQEVWADQTVVGSAVLGGDPGDDVTQVSTVAGTVSVDRVATYSPPIGRYRIVVTLSPPLQLPEVVFTVRVIEGPAARILLTGNSIPRSEAGVRTLITAVPLPIPQATFLIHDAGGNIVTTATTMVTAAVLHAEPLASERTVSGVPSRAGVDGTGSAGGAVLLRPRLGNYVLTLMSGALGQASLVFAVVRGPPAMLVALTVPQSLLVGSAPQPQPRIGITDVMGNRLGGEKIPRVINVRPEGTPYRDITGSSTSTVDGVATYQGLSFNIAVGTRFNLTFSSSGLEPVTVTGFVAEDCLARMPHSTPSALDPFAWCVRLGVHGNSFCVVIFFSTISRTKKKKKKKKKKKTALASRDSRSDQPETVLNAGVANIRTCPVLLSAPTVPTRG
jgi:hypothetical protein